MGFGQMESCGRRVVMMEGKKEREREKEVTKATKAACFHRKLRGIFALDVKVLKQFSLRA